MVSPLRLERESALGGDSLGGQAGGGDRRLLQGPLQMNLVLKAGEIQQAGDSDITELPDFWRELNAGWRSRLCKRAGAMLEAWEPGPALDALPQVTHQESLARPVHLSPGLPFSAWPKHPLKGLVKADPP